MDFQHADVFAAEPFTGNSVTVFLTEGRPLTAGQMLAITQEFRHFESIFLAPGEGDGAGEDRWRARVFDQTGELDFAGHPLLGAAAVLHDRLGGGQERQWTVELPAKTVTVRTTRHGAGFRGTLDQGRPEFGRTLASTEAGPVLDGLGLSRADLAPGLYPAVVSTGLRYLVVPVTAAALARFEITGGDFAARLSAVGAQYSYLLDPEGMEGRHRTNDGAVEDVATGSAAGTAGAYLARAGRVALNKPFVLHQGRFTGRPSQLQVEPRGGNGAVGRVLVGGQVAMVASGTLRGLPSAAR
jgi:trans-2,3-dihydro-3-hydroxyanthranilate isomerase